jgi:hypothetical protein
MARGFSPFPSRCSKKCDQVVRLNFVRSDLRERTWHNHFEIPDIMSEKSGLMSAPSPGGARTFRCFHLNHASPV